MLHSRNGEKLPLESARELLGERGSGKTISKQGWLNFPKGYIATRSEFSGFRQPPADILRMESKLMFTLKIIQKRAVKFVWKLLLPRCDWYTCKARGEILFARSLAVIASERFKNFNGKRAYTVGRFIYSYNSKSWFFFISWWNCVLKIFIYFPVCVEEISIMVDWRLKSESDLKLSWSK